MVEKEAEQSGTQFTFYWITRNFILGGFESWQKTMIESFSTRFFRSFFSQKMFDKGNVFFLNSLRVELDSLELERNERTLPHRGIYVPKHILSKKTEEVNVINYLSLKKVFLATPLLHTYIPGAVRENS